jgi:hypothetical protein
MRKRVRAAFGNTHQCISQSTLGQTQLLVYVRKGSAAVAVCAEWGVTCGVGNVLANKGALGLVLRVGGANVGVLTAHLAAHQGKVQARNDDFHRIMASSAAHLRGVDGVLFGGDLNYRLDLTKEEVELSLETDHADLLGCDQVITRCAPSCLQPRRRPPQPRPCLFLTCRCTCAAHEGPFFGSCV